MSKPARTGSGAWISGENAGTTTSQVYRWRQARLARTEADWQPRAGNGYGVDLTVTRVRSWLWRPIGTATAWMNPGKGNRMSVPCTHIDQIRDVSPRTPEGCEECLQIGDTWVHLRLCRICGHIGCCDSSKNKHATKHFHATTHPIMQSFEPGEDWLWCFVDEVALQPAG
jgi:hypothetical protein